MSTKQNLPIGNLKHSHAIGSPGTIAHASVLPDFNVAAKRFEPAPIKLHDTDDDQCGCVRTDDGECGCLRPDIELQIGPGNRPDAF